VHAGLEHTYGYLFSNLLTPYGYKRARWVQPDIETGLGLPTGSLSPTPTEGQGTFLGNITSLAIQFAFMKDEKILNLRRPMQTNPKTKLLPDGFREIASGLRTLKPESFASDRLTETIVVSPERTVRLRTDFVAFKNTVEGSTNTHLLIYSIQENNAPPRLITLFPVATDFRARSLDPANLGSDKPIITRYNAFVAGVTGTQWKGDRQVESSAQ
jgi:hypothetical protein